MGSGTSLARCRLCLMLFVSCCYGTRLYLSVSCISASASHVSMRVAHRLSCVYISSVYVQCTHDASRFTFNIPRYNKTKTYGVTVRAKSFADRSRPLARSSS